jgi:hypothetical protein
LQLAREPERWLPEADEMLAAASWDRIWNNMLRQIEQAMQERRVTRGRVEAQGA